MRKKDEEVIEKVVDTIINSKVLLTVNDTERRATVGFSCNMCKNYYWCTKDKSARCDKWVE